MAEYHTKLKAMHTELMEFGGGKTKTGKKGSVCSREAAEKQLN